MLAPIAPGVWVATSRVFVTTSTVVVTPDRRALVVDPGVHRDERASLAAEVLARGWEVVGGFSTHAHWDHLLWTTALGSPPRWARAAAVAAAGAERAALSVELHRALGVDDEEGLAGAVRLCPVPDGALPGLPEVVVVGHEAHAPGHAALLVPAARTLLAGDMLSDVEVPLLDLSAADPLGDYRDGLDRLAAVVATGDVDVVVPGHGRPASRAEAARRVADDMRYLDDLASGRRCADPRLGRAPAWLVAEHEAQAGALARRSAG